MLVDRHDPGEQPRLLAAVTQEIIDGHDPARTVAKRFEFVEIGPRRRGAPTGGGALPGLRAHQRTERAPRRIVSLAEPWLSAGADQLALDWAAEHAARPARADAANRCPAGSTRPAGWSTSGSPRRSTTGTPATPNSSKPKQPADSSRCKPDTAFRRARDLEAPPGTRASPNSTATRT